MRTSLEPSGLLVILFFLLSLLGCQETPKEQDEIAVLESRLDELIEKEEADLRAEPVQNIMKQLAQAYMSYASIKPDSPSSPNYLIKAADIYEQNLQEYNQALSILDTILIRYPNDKRSGYALFKKGFIYHNLLSDLDSAEQIYNRFIERHPEHELIPSALREIEELGIPPSRILEQLEADSLP